MAAPIEIPTHHVKQEFRDNRPPYRQGRKPKAVKVYTINQESAHLLVQDVPSLGATQELVKLFSTHGDIEEYRILDEYPTADQYTDVFLFKFKKIQSARHFRVPVEGNKICLCWALMAIEQGGFFNVLIPTVTQELWLYYLIGYPLGHGTPHEDNTRTKKFAKRKLDDWSFYGGVLHVSYAPEFESVDETRRKLQERRRVIAARIRLHGGSATPVNKDVKKSEAVPHQNVVASSSGTVDSHRMTNFVPQPPSGPQQTSGETSGNQNSHTVPHHQPQAVTEQPQIWLPPPPKQQHSSHNKSPGHFHKNYQFAKVPSAHATLQNNQNEAHLHIQNYHGNDGQNEKSHHKWTKRTDHGRDFTSLSQTRTTDSTKKQDTLKGDNPETISDSSGSKVNVNNSEETKNTERKKGGLVIREFKKSGTVPKFIPRQTLNIMKKKEIPQKSSSSVSKEQKDSVNVDLKKNAYILGEVQGPSSGVQSKKEVSKEEESVNKSRLQIRKRVAMFSTDISTQENKKKKGD